MTRDDICRKCRMLPSFDHPEYPCCEQPVGPISEEEYTLIGARPEDRPTMETVMNLAERTIRPYCLERMMVGGAFDGLRSLNRSIGN